MSGYLSIEVLESAYKLVRDIMKVQKDETVVITADTGSDFNVVEATVKASKLLGAKPLVLWYPMPPHVGKAADPYLPLKPLEGALRNADVWIEFNKSWLLYSTPWDHVIEEGRVRYICLVGMNSEMMVRTIGRVNIQKLLEFQRVLADITRKTRKMKITTPAGTNVEFENDPERPVFTEGDVQGPGDYMLIGQVDWAPVEETINGTIVFDGSVWPPQELGLLKNPIILEVEQGTVIKIKGGQEAKIFERWLKSFKDPNMFKIAHLSYGCNPGAKLTGNILEDERVWGVVEWGLGNQATSFKGNIGSAKSHTDGISLTPTVIGDGKKIIEDGEYVHPKLRKLAKKVIFY
ncbi:leucyl aminopeptidase (aminopeptidase T) [Pyrococcus sp. NA2]|uniref:aminopeptidase n=1 Tax=Pyrococcus sp. (strain NA2) TaxID=342949 RepID=UPI000209AA68|nr:leucyl aminopeptidase (aminopeptidase T) [Pyrococcus sp. NA2]AEC51393.1 leucyl aminopeptidase (aminopeptidase T) [Pyrococcus sp. NA2]